MRNLLAKVINKLERLPGTDTKPNFCCFGVTDNCILKCKMCRKWREDISVKPDNGPPDISQWKDAISSLKMITEKGFLINFGGGEPLMMDGLLELVRFASDNGFRTNIATNAYLIDEGMAKRIADSGLSTINISLDSGRKSIHDYLRGVDGVYEKATQAIGFLHRYCPDLKKGICTVISRINLKDITGLAEEVQQDSRLDWLYFMAVMQPNNTLPDNQWFEKEFSYLWPDAKEAAAVINRLIELEDSGYKIVNQVSQLKAFRSYFADPGRFVKLAPCNLSRAIHVSSVGDIFVCFRWGKLGNIKDDKIEDIWYSDKADVVRRDVEGCRNNCHFLLNCFYEGDLPFSF